jgi:hypothetical protein
MTSRPADDGKVVAGSGQSSLPVEPSLARIGLGHNNAEPPYVSA